MSRRVFIFINGICTAPGDAEGWCDRAVTWTHLHRPEARGEKFEYLAGALTRRFKQQDRAEKFARMILYYAGQGGWEINLVGHSNGCDIILRTLQHLTGRCRIEAVHLIAAACEADFEGNGLNDLLRRNLVGRVCVYLGGDDSALRLAKLTRFLRPVGLGYGTLGAVGARNAVSTNDQAPSTREAPISQYPQHRVQQVYRREFGHSTWFEKKYFDWTMGLITRGSSDPQVPQSGLMKITAEDVDAVQSQEGNPA